MMNSVILNAASRLLISLFTVRSDRQFCEQLAYNLLFRWFLDMDMTEQPFPLSGRILRPGGPDVLS